MKYQFLTIALLIIGLSAKAQVNDPVLMTIDGKPVTKSEFENVFKKNPGKEAEKKSVQEYMDLFVNFKLKVREAEQMGLDTMPNFIQELSGYRKQLAAPYLTDKNVNEGLITEAYERMKTEVWASHILVKCAEDALPKDTLAAYNKVMEFRKRVLKGEDFGKLAKESAAEGDPSAKENAGDLGYFTALQMIYAFENTAYNTKEGEVSMPVRTRFGFHILKVHKKRANQGERLIGHIMIRLTKEMKSADSLNAKKKIEEVLSNIKKGAKFEDMATQFSEDKQSAAKGGQLGWYSAGKMPVPEFETPTFSLNNIGDVSEPFMTKFGWHIIKLFDKKPLADFNSMKNDIKQKVSRDSRSQAGRSALIAKVKKESNFMEAPRNKKNPSQFLPLDEIYPKIDSTYFLGKWNAKEKASGLNKMMFQIGDKKYTQADFIAYIESHQTRRVKTDVKYVIDQQYKNFVDETIVSFEESQLEKKYPEFKALMQEYRDGILLFELTDKKVWSKAVKDTAGLKEFYEKNKQNYLWEERADVTTYKCNDADVAKKVRKMIDKKKTDKEILDEINKKSQLNLSIETVMYLKGENKMIDDNWKMGLSSDIMKDNKVYLLKVNTLLPKTPKQLNEAKGPITADYQNYLEKEWLSSLKANHKVEINKEVLNTIK